MSISICSENCEYRAEGNAGIVVRLIKENAVLKLRKQEDGQRSSPSTNDVRKDLENQIRIIQNVWKQFLGETFVHEPVILFLKAEEIRILNEAISEFRPAHRRHKNVKEVDTYACLLRDYCCIPSTLKPLPTCGPVLCVEIKPKQGFMKEDFFHTDFSTLPVPMCRYCMTQTFKLKRGRISSESDYCPLDLFSGCQNRMIHALKMLLRTPQNNLRIFKDQKLIYSEENKNDLNEVLSDFVPYEGIRINDFLPDLIMKALVKPFPYGMENAPIAPQRKSIQRCLHSNTASCSENEFTHRLPVHCVLERVLSIQRLDDLNITDLYQLYCQVKRNRDRYSDSIGCYSKSEIPPNVGQLRKAPKESDYQYASRKVWEFLTALIMKDCSIMVTMRRLKPDSSIPMSWQYSIPDKCGNSYAFSIAIADLDAKSMGKVEKVYNDVTLMIESLSD